MAKAPEDLAARARRLAERCRPHLPATLLTLRARVAPDEHPSELYRALANNPDIAVKGEDDRWRAP